MGWNPSQLQVPEPALHPQLGLQHRMVSNYAHQEGPDLDHGGVLREGF